VRRTQLVARAADVRDDDASVEVPFVEPVALEEVLGRSIYSDWPIVPHLSTDGRPLEEPGVHGFPEQLRSREQEFQQGWVDGRRDQSHCADRAASVVLAVPVENVVPEIHLLACLAHQI